MGMPGDNITVNMKLNYPLPILKGQRFALREGGKTVAAGVITKLLEDSEADIKEEEERIAKAKAQKWAMHCLFCNGMTNKQKERITKNISRLFQSSVPEPVTKDA